MAGPAAPNTTTPRIRTERLELAPLRVTDADEMVRVFGDPALHAFTGGDPPALGALRTRFERLVVGRSADGSQIWHNWIARRRPDGTAVGTVQATVEAGAPRADIAWVIGVPWQGLGYASEAAEALVGWLVKAGITTITAHIHPDHRASAAVATRAGLRPTNETTDGERVWLLAASPGRRPPESG
jgi:RimJ/RimL family protein N-acetyltransferase